MAARQLSALLAGALLPLIYWGLQHSDKASAQPVALRTSYGRPTIPISSDINQLTEQLVRSRLADEFRPRSGVLEPIVRENRLSPAFVLPSVDEELDGRLVWS